MRRSFPVRAAVALLALFLTAGCGNKVTAPASGLMTTTADDIAVQAVTSLGVMKGDIQYAISTTPQSSPAGARQAMPSRALWDTTFTDNGITFEASRDFYDADGVLLPGYGPLAVRLRWTSRAYGTRVGPRDTVSVGHGAVLDVNGIQMAQDTLRFDGACRDTLENAFRSLDYAAVRHFYWVSSTTLAAVRYLKSTYATSPWPIGGTVTFTVSADRLRSNDRADVEAHYDATVVVTFDGTSQAEMVVSGAYHYRWNLQTGYVTRLIA